MRLTVAVLTRAVGCRNQPPNSKSLSQKFRKDYKAFGAEANGGKTEESPNVTIEILEILGEVTAAIQPCNCSFDDPPFGQNDKTLGVIRSPDDFRFEVRQDFRRH
jgi:hypothetical protein